jgi:primosomal protein N' (replication factor Y)
VKRETALVVATAGAEPYVDGGYSAVVLLDAKVLLSRQSLRAEEDAVRIWSNAIAKGSPTSRSVLVGVSGALAQSFSLWDHAKISAVEFTARKELRLPPALRLGSITADQEMVKLFGEVLSSSSSVQTIGPAPVGEGLWRLLIKYPYAEGLALAQMLKSMAAKVSAGKSRIMRSGRSGRAITIKMNDPEVI